MKLNCAKTKNHYKNACLDGSLVKIQHFNMNVKKNRVAFIR